MNFILPQDTKYFHNRTNVYMYDVEIKENERRMTCWGDETHRIMYIYIL